MDFVTKSRPEQQRTNTQSKVAAKTAPILLIHTN